MVPDYCIKYGLKSPHSLRYHNNKKLWKIAIITHIWHRAKFYFTCNHNTWYLIMVPNVRKIHLVITEECARMERQMDRWTDRWMDRAHSYILWFCYCRAGHNNGMFHQQIIVSNWCKLHCEFVRYLLTSFVNS